MPMAGNSFVSIDLIELILASDHTLAIAISR